MSKQKPIYHPEIIKAMVRMQGKTFEEIAKDNNIAASTVRMAFIMPSLSGEKAIAKCLGIPLHELWPSRWTEKGQRIRPRYAHKYNKVA